MINRRTVKLTNKSADYEIAFAFCHPGRYRITNRPKLGAKNSTVEYSEGFWLQEVTVSLGLYEFVYGKPYYENSLLPEEKILFPWDEIDFKQIKDFLSELNNIISLNNHAFILDIPSITQWEHGLLCGNDAASSWGDDDTQLSNYAWYKDNSNNKVHASKQKKCNEWGLYDMYGNVHEYCYDSILDLDKSYFLNPENKIPSENEALPCMGGAYDSTTEQCNGFNCMGYYNQFIQPTGFRLIIKE
jgi:formylglycine-generating enzyme required for sulfatase activity